MNLVSTTENMRRLNVDAEVIASDLFSGLRGRRFETILFNPPLFDKDVEHDAELALCDPRGELLARFLADARVHLEPGGRIYFLASNLMNRPALLAGLKVYKSEIIAATHDELSDVSRWVISAARISADA